MEYYQKKRRSLRPICLFAMLCAAAIVLFAAVLRPIALDTAVYRGRTEMTRLLQETVLENIPEDMTYDDLVGIVFGDDMRVTAIKMNSAAVSRIQAEMTDRLNGKLTAWEGKRLSVPLGNLTGILFFNGRGPDVSFYIAPVSAASSEIRHKFESAGINQTRHTVELQIKVDAQTLLFGARTPFEVSTSVVLSDTVVVGVTPQIFAQMASGQIT